MTKPTFGRSSRILAATALSSGLLAAAMPAQADEALADLVEDVAPSVVMVLSTHDADNAKAGRGHGAPQGAPLEEFFRQFGPGREMPEGFGNNQPRQGQGSGFILDEDGWIVTNHHVVDGAESVTVRLNDDREFEAEIVGLDEQTDLALLRIDAGEPLPHVELGDSDAIRVGEDVVAVGNPFGLGGSVTSGIVSAKGRNIAAGPYADFLQTDAAINRGNSGGPLFNMDGEVVGVNSAIYSPSGGSVGVGFAVTSNIVDLIVDDLRDDGEVQRGWLGVSIQDVTPDLSAALGLDEPAGALVAAVVEDSPSEGTLEAGDVILQFDGKPVESSRDLPRLVAAAQSGQATDLMILRGGDRETVSVTLGVFGEEQASIEPTPEDDAYEALGATVAPLDETARGETGVGPDVEGVVVTSLSASGAASRAGLKVGDVILRVGSEDVATPRALRSALSERDAEPALMLINRGGRQIFVAVEVA